MLTNLSKGWLLTVLAAAVLVAPAPVRAAATDGQPTEPLQPNGSERIELVFSEPEDDLLTREAIEKLDAPIDSLEFANADLRNVIRIIGERLDINFIFDSADITGSITLRLRNVRLRDALDSILKTRSLAIIVDPSGIFRIVPAEQVNPGLVETRTEVIQLNWIQAEDIERTMAPFLSSEEFGRLVANQEANSVIVTDVPPQIEVIRGLITKLDIPERQVMIEARLIDINIGALRELSSRLSVSRSNSTSDWQGGVAAGDDESLGIPTGDALSVVNNLLDGFSVVGGAGTLALGDTISVLGNDFSVNAVFTALEARNFVEILANPRVSTINNIPANINIVEKIPYVSSTNLVAGAGSSETIEFADAGVMIEVTPTITPNDFVRMQIGLSQMIFRERVGGGALDPPAIDERNANTNVIVSDSSTAVLGGLRQKRELQGSDGVPWLHRIPLLGWLFKNKIYNQDKTELLLMITPSVIKETRSLTEREQVLYDKIETDWDVPDYMMDQVETHDDLHIREDATH